MHLAVLGVDWATLLGMVVCKEVKKATSFFPTPAQRYMDLGNTNQEIEGYIDACSSLRKPIKAGQVLIPNFTLRHYCTNYPNGWVCIGQRQETSH